jgi:hypothetical protein
MPYRTCDHLMEDGIHCNSPALRGQRFRSFHLNPDARRLRVAWASAYSALGTAKMRDRDLRRHSTKRKLAIS